MTDNRNNNNDINQVFPNGFGYKEAQGKKTEADRYKEKQSSVVKDIYSSFPLSSKSVPVGLGEDGLLQIPDNVPNEDYVAQEERQVSKPQKNQQDQKDYKYMKPQQDNYDYSGQMAEAEKVQRQQQQQQQQQQQ